MAKLTPLQKCKHSEEDKTTRFLDKKQTFALVYCNVCNHIQEIDLSEERE